MSRRRCSTSRGISEVEEITLSEASVEDIAASGLLDDLDAELLEKYPDEPTNGVEADGFHEAGGYFVAVRFDSRIVGCGAFRRVDGETVEIKRMYVVPEFRGRGLSWVILEHLESEARGRGYERSILETGVRQPAAISLYASGGYVEIPPFEPYVGNENSVCFAKKLRRGT